MNDTCNSYGEHPNYVGTPKYRVSNKPHPNKKEIQNKKSWGQT